MFRGLFSNGYKIFRKFFVMGIFIMVIFFQFKSSRSNSNSPSNSFIRNIPKLENINTEIFIKRSYWDLGKVSAIAGLVLTAATALFTGLSPVICVLPATPQCWTLILGLTLTATIAGVTTSYVAYKEYMHDKVINGGQDAIGYSIVERYSFEYSCLNTTTHMYPAGNIEDSTTMLYPPDDLYDDVVSKFFNVGLGVPILTVANSTKKLAGNESLEVISIHWNSDLGKHTATHLEHYNVTAMANDIAEQYNSGYNGSGIYTKSNVITESNEKSSKCGNHSCYNNNKNQNNERRVVDWVSYNIGFGVDNQPLTAHGLRDWIKSIGVWDGNIVQFAKLFYNDGMTESWKWKIDIVTDDSISSSWFLGRKKRRTVTRGEAYLNQYGGVES
ncbi:hypothetical protein TBLA_0D00740 [Henningerozyma blattae CBS 6284]|uniref:Uncharacterized protein n=1 Tax=Henningerozyma blattae (strain ATCC 34711 / CBS 6284 / DSM 70876 / NBRC 10599 / NRRL Y-10934 / UCD 77-7) TaxID=1071380 RepID=I2H2I0_HENB6|nr:hypothetical protein TBLA_0D00740 [Tetrapisispora blattae CBS 6284]CCH60582.1 hypothetical protein TBLA_0D00740 [Tetrapisispora blattae CBS 6284]